MVSHLISSSGHFIFCLMSNFGGDIGFLVKNDYFVFDYRYLNKNRIFSKIEVNFPQVRLLFPGTKIAIKSNLKGSNRFVFLFLSKTHHTLAYFDESCNLNFFSTQCIFN
ncbi:hypothetical protein HHI36_016467 [Cryptolaemus montrouzieri]|uniref:Uncharacterized protein n=1 Tax=Cryptolaemus montrouzieri TaxID=559131 RepID=A0ABD2NK27_9CUCU